MLAIILLRTMSSYCTELVEPILRKFVNPPKNDGLLDEVAIPLSKLDERIPGISDIREVGA